MSSVREFYDLVDDLYEKDEFLDIIESRRSDYGDLFSDELIANLVVAENGRSTGNKTDICDIIPGESATINGKVIDLGVLRKFSKGGGEGRVRNVRVDDGTGSVKLVLWDDETSRVGKDIVIGTEMTIVNGTVQDRGYGLQISPGKWGLIELNDE